MDPVVVDPISCVALLRCKSGEGCVCCAFREGQRTVPFDGNPTLTCRTMEPRLTLTLYRSLPGPVAMISDDRDGVYENVVNGLGASVLRAKD